MKKDLTNRVGYIYKLTAPNGKIYIGQTINKKQRKYHYNSGSYKEQVKLWYSTQKYNWNPANTFEIIEECLCGENKCFLNEREKYWIKYYDSYNNGLNCNEGGHGNLGYKPTLETRKKMSVSALKTSKERSIRTKTLFTGIKQSEESNKKRSERLKGIKRSDVFKNKMSKIRKENPMSVDSINKMKQTKTGVKSKKRKRVKQLDDNGNLIKIWEYAGEAEKNLNICRGKISAVCLGKKNKVGGFKWEYIN